MASEARGRPKSSSRHALEEAATELFLENGYHATTVDDIALRAGVSRATFFNYFPAKSAVLWVQVDDALERLERLVADGVAWPEALTDIATRFTPASLPLIATQAEAMNTGEDLDADAGSRVVRLSRIVKRAGVPSANVWPVTGAIVAAALEWAGSGVDRLEAVAYLERHGLLGAD